MHHDLNASNILLGLEQIYLIDFDKGQRVSSSGEASWKEVHLRRLRRSLDKLLEAGEGVDESWARLKDGYYKAD